MDKEPVQLKQDGPRFFFKYQGINKYTLQNLAENQLWMSQLKVFNDPFEGKYSIKDNLSLSKEQKEQLELISESGVICLTTHETLIQDPNYDDNLIFPENMLMWAHYANNHYGMCLGLRKKAIIYKVIYDDQFPEMDLNNEKIPLALQAFKIIHTKHKCWAYENEYRAMNVMIKNGGLPCENSYEIERIYFGMRTPESEINLVKNIVNDRDIKFYKAELNPCSFLINFNQI